MSRHHHPVTVMFQGQRVAVRGMGRKASRAALAQAPQMMPAMFELMQAFDRDESGDLLVSRFVTLAKHTDEAAAFLSAATGVKRELILRADMAQFLVLLLAVVRANPEMFAQAMPRTVQRELARIHPIPNSRH